MTTNTTPFDFHGHEVRTLTHKDGSHWFIADDIVKALGYKNTAQTVADHVHPDDSYIETIQVNGRSPRLVNESGMYSLVLRSRKPEAQAFARWVTSEVLPSLRRHGVYMVGQEQELPEGLTAEELATVIERRRAALDAAVARLQAIEAQQKADEAAYRARMLEYRQDREDAFLALQLAKSRRSVKRKRPPQGPQQGRHALP